MKRKPDLTQAAEVAGATAADILVDGLGTRFCPNGVLANAHRDLWRTCRDIEQHRLFPVYARSFRERVQVRWAQLELEQRTRAAE